jgi:hypothetical protein
MPHFIQLRSAKPDAVASYKKELRAIVVDRAAQHVESTLETFKRPTSRTYERTLQDSLLKAKLDVMAELFSHMQNLARPRAVSGWRRGEKGLVREPRGAKTRFDLINAYDDVLRYVSKLQASAAREPALRAAGSAR